MTGIDFLVDTNFAIYFLEGNSQVKPYLNDAFAVSVIAELELLGKIGILPPEIEAVNQFLDTCLIVELTAAVKDKTIALRRQHRIKLPDAIIAASAQWLKVPLLTADKGFKKVTGLDLVLLELP